MQAPMPPQAAPQGAPEAEPKQAGGGPVSQLVMGINAGMEKLHEMLPDDAKEGLGQLIQAYQSYVTEVLGAPQAPQAPEGAAPGGAVTPEQGANPNARPMV